MLSPSSLRYLVEETYYRSPLFNHFHVIAIAFRLHVWQIVRGILTSEILDNATAEQHNAQLFLTHTYNEEKKIRKCFR